MPTATKQGTSGQALGFNLSGTLAAYALLTGAAFTGAITITQDVGVAQTRGLGIQNTTPATVGVQKWSPVLELEARGWETTGGTSQAAIFRAQLETVQGATLTSRVRFQSNINGGSFNDSLILHSSGAVRLNGATLEATAGQLGLANSKRITSEFGGATRDLIGIDSSGYVVVGSISGSQLINIKSTGEVRVTSQTGVFRFESSSALFLQLGDGTSIWGRDDGTATTGNHTHRGTNRTGTDAAASLLDIRAPRGTGTGAVGYLGIFASAVGTTGTTQHAENEVARFYATELSLLTGLKLAHTAVKTTAYTILPSDNVIYVDPATPFALTLPSPATVGSGKVYHVVSYKAVLTNMTLVRAGSEKINNVAGTFTYGAVQTSRIFCNGTDWAVT